MREHVVETLEWQVAFASEGEAFEWQGRLASLVRGPALDAIAEVFDELGGSREVLALDTLEIDLGVLPRAGLEVHLKDRLRHGLREALQEALGRARTPAAGGGASLRPQSANRAEWLRHYLAHGFLPWQAGSGTRRRLPQLAERLAQDATGEMAQWLRGATGPAAVRWSQLLRRHLALLRPRAEAALQGDGPLDAGAAQAWSQLLQWDTAWLLARVQALGQEARVRRQMARHFGDAALFGLIERMVPGERAFIAAVIAEAAWFGRAQAPPLPPERMRPRLWEFTLAYLLVERGSEFNRQSYLGSLLRHHARRDGMDYGQLVRTLIDSVGDTPAASGLRRQMLQLLRELAARIDAPRDPDASGNGSTSGAARTPGRHAVEAQAARLGRAKLRLHAALQSEAPLDGATRHAWTWLRRWDPGWLVDEVRRQGQAARVRRRMARDFGHATLLALSGLLVPGEREFIEALVTRPAWLARVLPAPVPPRQLQPRLWEFTLAYVLAECGTGFNRRSYLGSVVRQLAREAGVAEAPLLRALLATLDEAGVPGGLQRQMRQLLGELLDALPAEAPTSHSAARGAPPGSRRWRQLLLPQLRFQWRAALAAAQPHAQDWQGAWDALARHDRAWLAEEAARHARSETARHAMAAGLPHEALLDLAELLMPGAGGFVGAVIGHAPALAPRAMQPAAAQRRAWEFTLAFMTAERGSEFNRRSYLAALVRRGARQDGVSEQGLLQALLHSLLAARDGGPMQRHMLALVRELLGAATPAAQDGATQGTALAEVLRAPGAPAAAEAARWRRRVEALSALPLAQAAAPLAALEQALDSPQAVQRLAMLLAPRGLDRLLQRLRPAEHRRIARHADALLAECAGAAVAASRARLWELRWRFILEYLFVQGRPFEAHDFESRMRHWLARQLGAPQLLARTAQSPAPPAPGEGTAPPPAPTQAAARTAPRAPTDGDADADEPIYVANAGLVLAEPFLPHLFTRCGLVQGGAFVDAVAASRAAHLLQAVLGGQGPWLEHELVLNKLVCGLPLAGALCWDGTLEPRELTTVDGMLAAMLQQWKVLGGTSVEGLRQTFLRREGRLVDKGDFWQLLVEPGPFDMLLDRLPWGFSTIKYPWMERMIHVQWR
jgi:hypothetical protein